jgi:hypothetical protein
LEALSGRGALTGPEGRCTNAECMATGYRWNLN